MGKHFFLLVMLKNTSVLARGVVGARAVASRGMAYKAPLTDMNFVLNEVMDAPKHWKKLGYEECTPDLVEGVLAECAKFSEEQLDPLLAVGDKEGCKLVDGNVKTPTGFKEAYKSYMEGGWQGLSAPAEYGGQNLPLSLGLIKAEMIGTANWSWGMYPGLSIGCMNTLILHGSEEQKQKYLTKLIEGTWTGTMCLTEPQCGSDLGLVTTKAIAQDDGTYKLSGTKIFISCGDHDWTENIVHIVLARLPGAPEGTKGISLFLVPKFIVNDDGSLSANKNVDCTRLENKMGIHGSATCEMTFDNSVGYMIGKENTGLKQMFTFMNTARLGTAVQGVATCEQALQGALPYARERISMRAVTGTKSADKPADPIIVHGDVRRNLLIIKSILEGGRAFLYFSAMKGDKMLLAKNEEEAKKFDRELGLFTPILKGFLTELGCEAASLGMQVWGGHGFIQENGMEQIYRDTRIATMYEGTTGIQALDLLARKVLMDKGKELNKFISEIRSTCFQTLNGDTSKQSWKLLKYTFQWQLCSAQIAFKAYMNKDIVQTAATDYLMFSGYVTTAYFWLRMMDTSYKALAKKPSNPEFYKAKIQTGEFYFNRVLPRASMHARTMTVNPSDIMNMKEESFWHE
eukprot:JP435681.1.p1 GENE.JP435681.1~~JP435681.1.p1  ORF type:complete len:629 (-),score=229.35 JP435681.1:238-2124(-)